MRSREPEPIDAGPDFRINKPSDTTSTLVSIYDSKDLFVKELQVLLAQRLLAIQDGNFDSEASSSPLTLAAVSSVPLLICFSRGGSQRRNIEILKVRTAAGVRSHVEGHDRLEADQPAYPGTERGPVHPSGHALAERRTQCVLHSTIISRHFWPPLQGNKLVMPTQFKEWVVVSRASMISGAYKTS